MSSKTQSLKYTLTKVVTSTVSTSKGKKSTGTVIGTMARDIQVITIAPFSL